MSNTRSETPDRRGRHLPDPLQPGPPDPRRLRLLPPRLALLPDRHLPALGHPDFLLLDNARVATLAPDRRQNRRGHQDPREGGLLQPAPHRRHPGRRRQRLQGEEGRRRGEAEGQHPGHVQHAQHEEQDDLHLLQLGGVRAVLLRGGAVHRSDGREHLPERGPVGRHPNSGNLRFDVADEDMGEEVHPDLGQHRRGGRLPPHRRDPRKAPVDPPAFGVRGDVRSVRFVSHGLHILRGALPDGHQEHRGWDVVDVRQDRVDVGAVHRRLVNGRGVDCSADFRSFPARWSSSVLSAAGNFELQTAGHDRGGGGARREGSESGGGEPEWEQRARDVYE